MTRRYGIVGLGHRAQLYVDALAGDWSDTGTIVALCDTNRTRMAYYNTGLRLYDPAEFPDMLSTIDALIVTTVDATHAGYVCAALEAGVDVIVEKPLTTDEEGCARIAAAAARSSARLIVTFNYRYSPRNSAVREVLASGRIGQVTAVHFEWLLDTIHGADYFRRWHRERENSGGLLVHKSTHHFDLVNWWLGSSPAMVFAQAGLRFYGPDGAGVGGGPFGLDLNVDPRLKALYLDAQHEDGYIRNQDVFGDGINIDDTMSVLVRYANQAVLTYSLTAYAPREGYRVAFTGTRGRLELEVSERAWCSTEAAIDPTAGKSEEETYERLTVQEHWKPVEEIVIKQGSGGHGGGDALLLDDVFRGPGDDPLVRQAGWRDGIRSVLTGVAADRSARSGQPVQFLADGLALKPAP
ncbi:Gfo/Idh/MocA family protein [Actinoplanes derwentensis]|uniref:Predicted dehydrogenase n=1 Tax=Actinoplanes derwentensis TaxID=113562 RepID=A0A1H1USH5_9ACTN|nr:Gfo/Idh/MocA family oxidoreductase [Actinoplanes derwentensis]GID88862.1 dehydrogenase [Actinoplanes derwentensis]SDS75423.1 Predicted dehydrogenase [Actinoplanes derwentensis]